MPDDETKPHDTYARLLNAASEAGVQGPSAIASELGESPQTVTNWRRRGVSQAGATSAQQAMSISASYVLFGQEPKLLGKASVASPEEEARQTGSMGTGLLDLWATAKNHPPARRRAILGYLEELLLNATDEAAAKKIIALMEAGLGQLGRTR